MFKFKLYRQRRPRAAANRPEMRLGIADRLVDAFTAMQGEGRGRTTKTRMDEESKRARRFGHQAWRIGPHGPRHNARASSCSAVGALLVSTLTTMIAITTFATCTPGALLTHPPFLSSIRGALRRYSAPDGHRDELSASGA